MDTFLLFMSVSFFHKEANYQNVSDFGTRVGISIYLACTVYAHPLYYAQEAYRNKQQEIVYQGSFAFDK